METNTEGKVIWLGEKLSSKRKHREYETYAIRTK
jgi:hypothetical protein